MPFIDESSWSRTTLANCENLFRKSLFSSLKLTVITTTVFCIICKKKPDIIIPSTKLSSTLQQKAANWKLLFLIDHKLPTLVKFTQMPHIRTSNVEINIFRSPTNKCWIVTLSILNKNEAKHVISTRTGVTGRVAWSVF